MSAKDKSNWPCTLRMGIVQHLKILQFQVRNAVMSWTMGEGTEVRSKKNKGIN